MKPRKKKKKHSKRTEFVNLENDHTQKEDAISDTWKDSKICVQDLAEEEEEEEEEESALVIRGMADRRDSVISVESDSSTFYTGELNDIENQKLIKSIDPNFGSEDF